MVGLEIRKDGYRVNAEIIALLNEGGELKPILDRAVRLLVDYLACDALGVRVMDSLGNIPYESAVGFTDAFLAKEGNLCIRRDRCACIEIARGEYDPGSPVYTDWGSFCTGDLQGLETVREGMGKGRFRGECVRSGWQSLAIVPVRFAHNYFGLIHAVDGAGDAFTPERVRFLELIAGQLGMYMYGLEAVRVKEAEFSSLAQRIAHDLKSPITSTQMYGELIALRYSDTLPGEVTEMLGSISRNAAYMEELVSGISGLVRAGDAASTQYCDICLDAFVESLVEDMGIREGGSIRVAVGGNMPVIKYPAFGLRRVLTNLLSNAVKFSAHSPTPAVEVSCEEKDTYYQVSVSDNGIGMGPDEVEKVFNPFYRTEQARDIPGTGLGLSICRKIVEKHGGRIWTFSDEGAGSTFYFTVPK